MDYREHPVPPALDGVVASIWTLEGKGHPAAMPEPVLPDGHPELIVHFGDPFERIDAGRVTRQPPILVAGQLSSALWLRPTGRVGVLGVRLTPPGGLALTGVPQHHLVGATAEARAVAPALAAWLEEVRDRAASPADAAAMVGSGLVAFAQARQIDTRLARAVQIAGRPDRLVSIEAIASDVGLTRRHLERLFREQVGLTPRTYARVRRFQRALASLEHLGRAGSARPGTETALRSGYADQAHFVRDFRALAGSTPSAHLIATAELTGFFVDRSHR